MPESNGQRTASPQERIFLVYGENGMLLVYSGDDTAACERACAGLATANAGYVAGYQFVGRQRLELRAYFERKPDEQFMARRSRRELFDFAWHPRQ